jgi:integrase/recombinase XerD
LRDYALKAIVVYLAERRDANPALFVAHSRNARNARLTITSVHNIVKKAVEALRLEESLSAHDFRHYRATQLLRAGMPLEVVQEYLGHADITTTRNIYAPVLGTQVVSEWLDNVDLTPEEAIEAEG